MGIASVGHRLTILKSVYDVKKAQDIAIENDHYVPLSKFQPSSLPGSCGNKKRERRRRPGMYPAGMEMATRPDGNEDA